MKTKEAGTAESDDDAATTTATDDDDDDAADAAVVDSSSPISAALKRARVLFGSGKSIYQLSFSLHCFLHCALPI
jgi:hypothetical protein